MAEALALRRWPRSSPTAKRFAGRRVALILAGGNIDPRLAASIMVRELAREERVIASASSPATGRAASPTSPV